MRQLQDKDLLNQLCDLYGSDKGSVSSASTGHPYPWPAHTYTRVYADLFAASKDRINTVFECGLGTNNPNIKSSMQINGKPGASLRVWRDYFSNAVIYGADIDSNILFTEDRIFTGYMDQTDSSSVAQFWQTYDVYPDVIIDDGLHEYTAGITLFEGSFERLASNGVYVIEDVHPDDRELYMEYFNKKEVDFRVITLNNTPWKIVNNTLVVVYKD